MEAADLDLLAAWAQAGAVIVQVAATGLALWAACRGPSVARLSMRLRPVVAVTGAVVCACMGAVQAQTIDANECRDQADRLRREARDLADAAGGLRSDGDESGARDVRDRFDDVRSRLARTASACGSRSQFPAVIASIRQYLLLRHHDVPETRARLKVVDAELVALAQLHVRAQQPAGRSRLWT